MKTKKLLLLILLLTFLMSTTAFALEDGFNFAYEFDVIDKFENIIHVSGYTSNKPNSTTEVVINEKNNEKTASIQMKCFIHIEELLEIGFNDDITVKEYIELEGNKIPITLNFPKTLFSELKDSVVGIQDHSTFPSGVVYMAKIYNNDKNQLEAYIDLEMKNYDKNNLNEEPIFLNLISNDKENTENLKTITEFNREANKLIFYIKQLKKDINNLDAFKNLINQIKILDLKDLNILSYIFE